MEMRDEKGEHACLSMYQCAISQRAALYCTSDDLWRWSPQETSLPDWKGRPARIELPLGGSNNLRILLSLFPAFGRHQYS